MGTVAKERKLVELRQAAEQLRLARDKRDRLVVEARKEGATIYELANATGHKSPSQIRRILKGSLTVALLALVFAATPASAHRGPVKTFDVEARGVPRKEVPKRLPPWVDTVRAVKGEGSVVWYYGDMRARQASKARRRAAQTTQRYFHPWHRVVIRVVKS